jgi:chondroitin sulfate proteoglycan 4
LAAGRTDYCVIELVDGMVQVHINLGSGDTTLGSPPGVVFNDLQWHSLDLERKEESLRLTIDNMYPETTTTPGQFVELNIDKGLYVGGIGSFNPQMFIGHFKDFRGCLQTLVFNSVNVFLAARTLQADPMNVYGVEWECSAEFGATSDQPISFLHNTSFASFPSLQTRQNLHLNFDLKTRADRALLVYNSGRSADSDLLALEIVLGCLKLTVNKGSGFVEVMSRQKINDGNWHQVEVNVNRHDARLIVDGFPKEQLLNFGDNIFLDLHGALFVGGVGVVARSFAIHQSLHSLRGTHAAAGSFIGCLHNFHVDGRLLGFREIGVSRGLRPECVWTYPCLSSPCIDGATCEEEGFYYYRCQCAEGNCFKKGAPGEGETVTPVHDVLHVQDIVLREGTQTSISTRNIELIQSPEDIRDSGIVFRVTRPPLHGNITVDGATLNGQNTIFTRVDLSESRVVYSHDGSEDGSDSIGFQLEFMDITDETPDIFRNKYGFTLMVRVAPWNDKPVIAFPQNDTLVLAENTQVTITTNDFTAIDNDDRPSHLDYTIQYQHGYNIGFFELSDALGVRARITSFTQEDIESGKIRYVHRGARLQQVRLQVSDGKDVSDSRILKIQAEPLRLFIKKNTGLVIASSATTLIQRENLTFVTNSRSHQFDIHYEITDPPYYGEIQKQQYADNSWVVTTTFTQETKYNNLQALEMVGKTI